jgi:hypothetical protein
MFRCVKYTTFRKNLFYLALQLLLSNVCYVCYNGCAIDYNLYVFVGLQCIYND